MSASFRSKVQIVVINWNLDRRGWVRGSSSSSGCFPFDCLALQSSTWRPDEPWLLSNLGAVSCGSLRRVKPCCFKMDSDGSLLFYGVPRRASTVVCFLFAVFVLPSVESRCRLTMCSGATLFWPYSGFNTLPWLWQSVKFVSPLCVCVFVCMSPAPPPSPLRYGLPVLLSSALSVHGALSPSLWLSSSSSAVLKTHKGRALATTRDSHEMTLTEWKDATLNDARHGESLRVEEKAAILGMIACSGASKIPKKMYIALFRQATNVSIRVSELIWRSKASSQLSIPKVCLLQILLAYFLIISL